MSESSPALSEGDEAPDFELRGVCDGEMETYTLDELTEVGAVLIGVYAFDFSPVCTRQLCYLQEMDWYGYKTNLSVVGIGADGPYSHMEFAEQEDLDFPLLCDLKGGMLDDYGVLWEEANGFENVPRRSVFLIDETKTVVYRWLADDNWDEVEDFGLNPVGEAIERL